ncbi:hypothetical protein [Mycobacterium sp. SA01]|uniref:hypothetical protein n=1 Tax=Mycobacterium sp. SA01 TaxID=3238820 RepID=UPI00351B29ED
MWGKLWEFPFHADIWGDVATWAGAVSTGLAALIAAITYARSSRAEKWAQAKLIYFEIGARGKYVVHNRSDKPIVGVRAVPVRRSLWSAAKISSFTDSVIFSFFNAPSYELYEKVRQTHSRKNPTRQHPGNYMFAEKIEADHSASVDARWIHINGYESYIEFRDVYGQDWRWDIEEEKLKPVERRPSPLRLKSNRRSAAWWILKNECIHVWRHHLYHPSGRPESRKDESLHE